MRQRWRYPRFEAFLVLVTALPASALNLVIAIMAFDGPEDLRAASLYAVNGALLGLAGVLALWRVGRNRAENKPVLVSELSDRKREAAVAWGGVGFIIFVLLIMYFFPEKGQEKPGNEVLLIGFLGFVVLGGIGSYALWQAYRIRDH